MELYGLGDDVPKYLDLKRVTMSERDEMIPRIPPHLVPILNDGSGNHFCLDSKGIAGADCPVVFWDHDSRDDQEPEVIAGGFVQWLNTELDTLEAVK